MNFTDPLERLMSEHQHGLKELEKMLSAGIELKTNGFKSVTYEALCAATNFINKDIRTHNQNEENTLFPKLEAKIGEGGPTSVMRSEHQQLWSALDQLESELRELPSSTSDATRIARIAELTTFIHDLLKQHISKEDNILYPMARQMLTQEDLRQVSLRMEDAPDSGPSSV